MTDDQLLKDLVDPKKAAFVMLGRSTSWSSDRHANAEGPVPSTEEPE